MASRASKSTVTATSPKSSSTKAKAASSGVKKTSSTAANSSKKVTKAAPKASAKPVAKSSTKSSSKVKSDAVDVESDVSPPVPVVKATKAASKSAAPKKTAAKKTKTVTKRKREADDELPAPKKKVSTKSPVEAKALPQINSAPTRKLEIFGCGEGSAGELGMGPRGTEVKRPRNNELLNKLGVVQISAGGMHSVALTRDNKIVTWGVNDQGTLGRDTKWDGGLVDVDEANSDSSEGDGLNPKESTPTAIDASSFPSGTEFVQVVAGDSCSFALTTTGQVFGWGTFRDSNGVYGFTLDDQHNIIKQVDRPMLVPKLKDIVEISAGSDFAVALDKNGNVYAWGCGQQDQLGRRLVDRRRQEALIPTLVGTPKRKIEHIFAGSNHTFALEKDSKAVWSWGLNNFGQTGVPTGAGGDSATVTAPTKVPFFAGMKMKQFAPGGHNTLALTEDGKLYSWGRVDRDTLGMKSDKLPTDDEEQVIMNERGKPGIVLKPQLLELEATCCSLSEGHALATSKDGKAYSWGYGGTYQLGFGDDEDLVEEPTQVKSKAIAEKKLAWVGAGGQYSLFGAYSD